MENKGAKIYCLNRNCSLFEKDLATGLADVTFIFCPRCTRKLFKEDDAKRNKQSQVNRANNNINANHSTRSRSYQNNTNRKQQYAPSASNGKITNQPDPTVVMLFERMLNIISTSVKYD